MIIRRRRPQILSNISGSEYAPLYLLKTPRVILKGLQCWADYHSGLFLPLGFPVNPRRYRHSSRAQQGASGDREHFKAVIFKAYFPNQQNQRVGTCKKCKFRDPTSDLQNQTPWGQAWQCALRQAIQVILVLTKA